jgi:hypothetical protein
VRVSRIVGAVLDTAGGMFAVLCKAETGLAITGKAY